MEKTNKNVLSSYKIGIFYNEENVNKNIYYHLVFLLINLIISKNNKKKVQYSKTWINVDLNFKKNIN